MTRLWLDMVSVVLEWYVSKYPLATQHTILAATPGSSILKKHEMKRVTGLSEIHIVGSRTGCKQLDVHCFMSRTRPGVFAECVHQSSAKRLEPWRCWHSLHFKESKGNVLLLYTIYRQ